MNKFIALSFLVLGVGFYELSGGADFVPETRETAAPQVARAQSIDTVVQPRIQPASLVQAAPAPAQPNIQRASFTPSEPAAELPTIDLSKFSAPERTPEPQASAINEEPTEFVGDDIRRVTGTVVNMRSGPGTDYEVVAQLIEGDRAEVLIDDGTGWVQLRLQGGQTGWMADFLLTN